MDVLTARACDAHGGLARWRSHSTVTARVRVEHGSDGTSMVSTFGFMASTHAQVICLDAFGPDRFITSFTPARVEVFDRLGARLSEARPALLPPWQGRLAFSQDLGDVCALSVSLWAYLNFPFVAALDGFHIHVGGASLSGRARRSLELSFPTIAPAAPVRLVAHLDPADVVDQIDWLGSQGSGVRARARMTYIIGDTGLRVPSHVEAFQPGNGTRDGRRQTGIEFADVVFR